MELQIRLAEWEVPVEAGEGSLVAIRGAHLSFPGGGREPGMSLRQIVLTSLTGIAVLFAGSIAIVHRLTELPAGTPLAFGTPAPRTEVAGAPPAVAPPAPVVPPAGASGRPAPPAARRGETSARRFLPPRPPPARGRGAAAAPARIKVALRTDPTLRRGLHMGDAWRPSAAYTAHRGGPVVLQAKVSVFDARGVKIAAAPTWTARRPDVVVVSPGKGDQVELKVMRPGETEVAVTAGAVTRALAVKAVLDAGALRAEITQR